MPIYEYRCAKCFEDFETRRAFSEFDQPAFCPSCGGEGQRQLSSFAPGNLAWAIGPAKQVFRPKKGEKS